MGNKTTALTPAEVESIDWPNEGNAALHTVNIRIDSEGVYDRDTNKLIAAVVDPDYFVFWNHAHAHFGLRSKPALTPQGMTLAGRHKPS